MTPFRARVREIAEEAAASICRPEAIRPAARVESAIYRAIEELLAREPSEGMINAGVETFGGVVGTPEMLAKPAYVERMKNNQRKAVISHFAAMSAQLLKECKE